MLGRMWGAARAYIAAPSHLDHVQLRLGICRGVQPAIIHSDAEVNLIPYP